jgi:hypothetical protein
MSNIVLSWSPFVKLVVQEMETPVGFATTIPHALALRFLPTVSEVTDTALSQGGIFFASKFIYRGISFFLFTSLM